MFSRLLTFSNVIVTGHQAFSTEEALERIASTTPGSVSAFAASPRSENEVAVSN